MIVWHLTQPTTAAVVRIVRRTGPQLADVIDLEKLVPPTGALPPS